MKIGIAGPISTESIAMLLGDAIPPDLKGASGAPLLGTLIRILLERGHSVSAYTMDSSLRIDEPVPRVAAAGRFRIYYVPVRKRAFRYENGLQQQAQQHDGESGQQIEQHRPLQREARSGTARSLVPFPQVLPMKIRIGGCGLPVFQDNAPRRHPFPEESYRGGTGGDIRSIPQSAA